MGDSPGLCCGSCGTQLGRSAKFCSECGTPVARTPRPAEYKQVTVLFADVVGSMEIAAAVGPERLREIMAALADCCADVVTRFGGTVDKFTGDGIMAVFGAPVALEDHAVRACRAAVSIQEQIESVSADAMRRDGVELALRIGLNSGQVIAGEIGYGPFGYTAVGDQVGMAQRMESVAPPGGVMLGESTARLVDAVCELGDAEMVAIKGSRAPVRAVRLHGIAVEHHPTGAQSTLVGRELEMQTLSGLLDRAIDRRGSVVCVVGPPGIGKSRLVREVCELARARRIAVFTTFCESHATRIPFHAATRLFRASLGISGRDDADARARVRRRLPEADPDDLLLLDDLLGIADPHIVPSPIDPDARRRRLGALINTANLARTDPILYVMEDAHWIDEVSESMMDDVLSVIPQAPALALITYRPEYAGKLAKVPGVQTISLSPLAVSEIAALVDELVGADSSAAAVKDLVIARAAGNPFFAHEIVRELTEQGVLEGDRGAYSCRTDVTDVSVPATVQAALAARIDRLDAAAKATINAAAVVGSHFTVEYLSALGVEPAVEGLINAELVDEMGSTARTEYVFRHPLIRAVAYESQLKSDRANLHRRLAAEIEARDPASADENAALIAEHLEAAGESHAAFPWHMRGGGWAVNRDISAARRSWERAKAIADALPPDHPDRPTMQIAPRTMLCACGFRGDYPDTVSMFDELNELCQAVGDKASLATGMTGLLGESYMHGRLLDAARLADEQMALVESIGDPALTLALFGPACVFKHEIGDFADVLRWSERAVELLTENPATPGLFIGSPLALALALRGFARWTFGIPGWREDRERAVSTARATDPVSYAVVLNTIYTPAIACGVVIADDQVLGRVEEALRVAERSVDDVALGAARTALGVVLVHRQSPEDRARGLEMLEQLRIMCIDEHYFAGVLRFGEVYICRERVRNRDDIDASLARMRSAVGQILEIGQRGAFIASAGALVEALLDRGSDDDLNEVEKLIKRLLAVPFDDGLKLRDIWALRLQVLLAHARGPISTYRTLRDRYRALADSLGYDGHRKWAEELP